MATNSNVYIPTACEEKLLAALADPTNFGKSITDICDLAEVSRHVYYDAIKKKEFIDYLNGITKDMIKSKLYEVYQATFKYAKDEKKNNPDRKLLFEILGEYKPEVPIQNNNTFNFTKDMTPEEIQKHLDQLRGEVKEE